MILLEDILLLHKLSIDSFGGSHAIRDSGLLESAIARPFQSFDGQDLYPSVFEKAAALAESLIVNHPFVDGNKRTGTVAMIAFLQENNLQMTIDQEGLYNFIVSISTCEIKFEEIVQWLKANTK
jgi:death on curing protein